MKYIEGSDGFYVYPNGDIYRHGKKLTPHSGGANDKYYKQRIYNLDGTVYRQNIHRIVAKYYLPNPLNLPCVNHKNGLKRDNRVENLEWCTVADNIRHARETGLNNNKHENHHQATLTNAQIHEICQLMQDGWRNKEISEKFGILKHIPTQIRNGVTWKEISSEYDVKRKRSERISEETVRWICERLVEGLSNTQIINMSRNCKLTQGIVCHIRTRRNWTEISKDYEF